MTTTTIFAGTNDGYVQSTSTTYTTARSGAGLFVNTALTTVTTGQQFSTPDYNCFEGFESFDTTSVLPGGEFLWTVILSLFIPTANIHAASAFVAEARMDTWSVGGLTTGDYIAGASLSAQTLVANKPSDGMVANAYNDFSMAGDFPGQINLSGTTEIIITSDRLRAGTTPTQDEYVSYNSADASGTTNDPKLTITSYAAAAENLRITPSGMRWRA